MNVHSAWTSETGQTREDTRLTQLGATTPTDATQVRSGILPGSDTGTYRVEGFSLTRIAAMKGTVHAGRAVVQGTAGQGAYPATLSEPMALTFDDGDPQFPRIDLVVLRVYDDLYDGMGRNEAAVEIVKGQAKASATPPDIPPLSLPLYQVPVPAGASAGAGDVTWNALVDLRTTTVAVGGIVPAYGDTGAAGSYPGQYKDVSTTAPQLQRWDGSAWVAYPSAIGGIAPIGALTSASYIGQYRDAAGGVLQRWDGSAWQPVAPGPAIAFTDDAATTSSTAYTETVTDSVGFPMVVAFKAPASGKVVISLGASASVNGQNASGTAVNGCVAWVSANVRQGTTVKSAATDNNAARNTALSSSDARSVSVQYPVTGLTPGSACTATIALRVSLATGASATTTVAGFDNIYLRVEPA